MMAPYVDWYGSPKSIAFIVAWLRERPRPGYEQREGAPYTDADAWADAIRQGNIDKNGWWIK